MPKKSILIIAFVILVAFASGYILRGCRQSQGGNSSGQEYIDNTKRELDAERNRLAGEREQLEIQGRELDDRKRSLNERETEIGEREAIIESRLDRLQQEAGRLEQERTAIERERSINLADREGYERIDQHLVNALMALDLNQDRTAD